MAEGFQVTDIQITPQTDRMGMWGTTKVVHEYSYYTVTWTEKCEGHFDQDFKIVLSDPADIARAVAALLTRLKVLK